MRRTLVTATRAHKYPCVANAEAAPRSVSLKQLVIDALAAYLEDDVDED